MSQIQIKPFSEEDVEGFHQCLDAVARERRYLGGTKALPLEATRKWLLDAVDRGDIRLLAFDGPQVIGWCDIETPTREGFTHSGKLGMGLLPVYRGRGLGTALLERALAAARERGLERVELDVYASNVAAIRLYEKFGFQVEGRKRRARKLDEHYEDIIAMALLFDSESDGSYGMVG